VINNSELQSHGWTLRGPGILNTMGDFFPLLKQTVLHGLPDALARFLFAAVRQRSDMAASLSRSRPEMPGSYYFTSALRDRKLSRVSAWLMRTMDLTEIRARRRLNYSRLLAQISQLPGAEPLFKDLPPGVCPLFLPIITPKARQLAHRLRAMSIPAIAWWAGYHGSFPDCGGFEEACYLKDNMVALPVHQQLDSRAIDFIAAKAAALLPGA
jgi:hypothetical protein